jgi:iron complex outermembrane receptor protein
MPNTDPFEEGRLQQNLSNGENTLFENYLTYTLNKDDHNFTLLGGYSYQKNYDRWSSWSIRKFADNGIEPRYNPGLGQTLTLVDTPPSGGARINELQSFFGRANYSYKGKYMVTATVRADGSSKFGENNKYGVFPSFAAGWRISEESFMQSSSLFNNLKLRAGWGQTGNQEIPPKITQALYTTRVSSTTSYPLSETGPYPAGTTFVRLANPNIQWEVSTQTNIGLDFGMLNGALTGTIDYFNKVSNNILLEVVPSDPIQPATTYWTNVEDMNITNKGLEIALDYQRRNKDGFSYGVGGNITFIDNIVEDSPFTILATGSAEGSGLTGATINGMINGYPIGTFYMQEFLGIGADGLSDFAESPDAGRKVVGHALPDVMYNFYINMEYKGFDFSANFNGVSGNMIYNNTAMNKFYKAKLANSLNTTDKAIEFPNESIINSSSVSTRYLEDGSFLRLNNATLGYNFNTKSVNWIENLRLSVTGQNLFVITSYSGFDPEVNQDRSMNGIQSFGIDLNGYPKARTFVFGINVTF